MSRDFPKIIWMAWFQGIEEAPNIVRICYDSWVVNNPGWKVVFLNKDNMTNFFDIESVIGKERDDIGMQQKSDVLRLNLLSKYGGVWADATCFCSAPLDTWIYDYTKSGFFVFRHTEKDRILSNWFIASEKNCYLTQTFCEEHNRYWTENFFSNQRTRLGCYLAKKLPRISRKTGFRTDFLISNFMQKVLKIYPYFAFHYGFASHIRRNAISRRIFKEVPHIDSKNAFQLLRLSSEKIEVEEISKTIADVFPPVHKLTWKEKIFVRETMTETEYLSTIFRKEIEIRI